MRQALGLAPGLAGQVFGGAEQLRGAEQAAGTAQAQLNMEGQIAAMKGQLKAMGLDQGAIENVLRYMQLRALARSRWDPRQEQQTTQRMAGIAPLLSGIMGQGGGGGMLSGLFGGGGGQPIYTGGAGGSRSIF